MRVMESQMEVIVRLHHSEAIQFLEHVKFHRLVLLHAYLISSQDEKMKRYRDL